MVNAVARAGRTLRRSIKRVMTAVDASLNVKDKVHNSRGEKMRFESEYKLVTQEYDEYMKEVDMAIDGEIKYDQEEEISLVDLMDKLYVKFEEVFSRPEVPLPPSATSSTHTSSSSNPRLQASLRPSILSGHPTLVMGVVDSILLGTVRRPRQSATPVVDTAIFKNTAVDFVVDKVKFSVDGQNPSKDATLVNEARRRGVSTAEDLQSSVVVFEDWKQETSDLSLKRV